MDDLLARLVLIGVTNGATLALNTLAVTIIFSVSRSINFALGDVFALSTVFAVTVIRILNLNLNMPVLLLLGGIGLAVAATGAFAAGLNGVIERIAYRPFHGRSRLAPLIATMGISFVLYQVALLWRKFDPGFIPGEHRSSPGLPEAPRETIHELIPDIDLGQVLGLKFRLPLRDVLLVLVAILGAIGAWVFLNRTRTGLAIRALAQNEVVAQMMGVDITRSTQRAFWMGGVFAGVAAVVMVLYTNTSYGNHGLKSGLMAFAAAVLGGIGSPLGALVSSMLIALGMTFSDFYIGTQWTRPLFYAGLVALLVLRPNGLFGDGAVRDTSPTVDLDVLVSSRQARGFFRTGLGRWVLLGAVMLFPLIDMVMGWGQVSVGTVILIYAAIAIALNFLLGQAGMLDLGFAVMFAIGAYTSALLTDRYGILYQWLQWPLPVEFGFVILLGALLAGLIGALNGWLSLRSQSDYLALTTLACGLVVQELLIAFSDLTGGFQGISTLPPPIILGIPVRAINQHYFLVVGALMLAIFVARRLTTFRIGRAFSAVGEDRIAAESAGVSQVRYQIMAFAISGGLAGAIGALYASIFSYVVPDIADFSLSAMLLSMVIIGGLGDTWGTLIGALLLGLLDRIVLPALGGWLGQIGPQDAYLNLRQLSYLTFGASLYLSVLLRARPRQETPPRGKFMEE